MNINYQLIGQDSNLVNVNVDQILAFANETQRLGKDAPVYLTLDPLVRRIGANFYGIEDVGQPMVEVLDTIKSFDEALQFA